MTSNAAKFEVNTFAHLPGVCPEGYTSAGADCDDIDECVANNGHGPCQDVCVNTDGSFKCACDVRFLRPKPIWQITH